MNSTDTVTRGAAVSLRGLVKHFGDVHAVDVAEDRSITMTMLFDQGHNLDERILAEQFID